MVKGSKVFSHLHKLSEIDESHIKQMRMAIMQKDQEIVQAKTAMSAFKKSQQSERSIGLSYMNQDQKSKPRRSRPQTAKHRVP